LTVGTRLYFISRRSGDGAVSRQTSPSPRSPPPPPPPHDHSPPHDCAYPSRHSVHCTPLVHAADRWRSVCTMTDAPAQSHLRLRCSTCVLPDGLATAQVSDRLRRSDPPPHAHARTPPHHCAYAPRHIVHCTPLAHAADRWRSVCTITDAPAQSRLKLRRSHVHYVPSLARTLRSPCHAPVCATVRAP
jgi:hypothetical protein